MKKTKIKIVKLGTQRHEYLYEQLKKYKSNLFEIQIFEKSGLPKMDCGWGYSFNALSNLLVPDFDNTTHDMCIGFIDHSIQDNLYGKCLDNNGKVYIRSFFQAAEFLQSKNIDVFNYMLKSIYRDLTRYIVGRGIGHHDTRGCLFDYCGNKEDITVSTQNLIICSECESKIKSKEIPENYLRNLKNEIKRVKKQRYYRILDFIKRYPILSILIGVGSSFLINILANLILM